MAVLIKREIWMQTHTQGIHCVKMKAAIRVMLYKPRTPKMGSKLPEASRDTWNISLSLHRRNRPCQQLDLGFPASRTETIN